MAVCYRRGDLCGPTLSVSGVPTNPTWKGRNVSRCPLHASVRWHANDQAYFLTAFSMDLPALAKSSGTMTG